MKGGSFRMFTTERIALLILAIALSIWAILSMHSNKREYPLPGMPVADTVVIPPDTLSDPKNPMNPMNPMNPKTPKNPKNKKPSNSQENTPNRSHLDEKIETE